MAFSDPYELNYSKVRAFRNCPVLYEHIYVSRKRMPLTGPASLGISLHRSLEAFCDGSGDGTMDDLLECYGANWLGAGYNGAQEQMEYFQRGREMLARFWRTEKERKSSTQYVERDFEFEYKKWKIRGTIDRVDVYPDDTWEVIDYKTGQETFGVDELGKSLQLGIYGIGAARAWNIKPALLSVWFLSSGGKISVPYDQGRDGEILAVFEEAGEQILRGVYSPNREYCAQCPMKEICRYAM